MKSIDYMVPIILTIIIMGGVAIEINIITDKEMQDEDKVVYTEYCTEECETYHSNECEKASTQF